jgi:transcriptional regulator with XRE-family HTH domain
MKKSTHSSEYRKLRAELVRIRAEAGLSQRGLAEILQVQPSWVAKVESGERRIDLIEFCWFLAACGGDTAVVLPRIMAGSKTTKGGRKL